MNVRYRVELSQAEHDELAGMLSAGKQAVRKLKRAQILLAADAGRGDEEIARSVAVGGSTVYRTKRRFVEGNLERALNEEPRPGAERKLTGKEEALLVATACAKPPKGRRRWTLQLLAGEMVKLTDHESLSHETVRRRLAENHLKPWRRKMWCIPRIDGEYVARMEDVQKTCSISTLKRQIRRGRWSVSTRARSSSSARCASPSRPSRANSNDMITNTAATAPSISSSSSMPIDLGVRSRRPSGARPKIMLNACANSSMSTIPMPTRSASCRTICRATLLAPSMTLSRPPKPDASCAASSSTTPPNTPAGSTWWKSRSACCAANASIVASMMRNNSSPKSPLGSDSEMQPELASTGCSQPKRHAPKCGMLTLSHPKSHNHCAEVLVAGVIAFDGEF